MPLPGSPVLKENVMLKLKTLCGGVSSFIWQSKDNVEKNHLSALLERDLDLLRRLPSLDRERRHLWRGGGDDGDRVLRRRRLAGGGDDAAGLALERCNFDLWYLLTFLSKISMQ